MPIKSLHSIVNMSKPLKHYELKDRKYSLHRIEHYKPTSQRSEYRHVLRDKDGVALEFKPMEGIEDCHKKIIKKGFKEMSLKESCDISTHGNTKGKDKKKYKKMNDKNPIKGHYKHGTSGSETPDEISGFGKRKLKIEESELEEIITSLLEQGYTEKEIEDYFLNEQNDIILESHSEHDIWNHYHSRCLDSWEKIGQHLEDQAKLQNKMMKNAPGEHAPYISPEVMEIMSGHMDNALKAATRHTEGLGYSLKNILNNKK